MNLMGLNIKKITKSMTGHRQSFAFIVFLLLNPIFAQPGFSKSYSSAYKAYVSGNYTNAKSSAKAALSQSKNKKTKSDLHRLLGIIYYTEGNKLEARRNFSLAKFYYPRGRIARKDVLDNSVVSFFNSTRSAGTGKPAATYNVKPQKTKQTKLNKRPPREARKVRPKRPARTKNIASNSPKKAGTFIFIQSNANNASVLLDGIFSGQTNTKINSDPGTMQLKVFSPGYYDFSKSINLKKGTTNKIQVTLKTVSYTHLTLPTTPYV